GAWKNATETDQRNSLPNARHDYRSSSARAREANPGAIRSVPVTAKSSQRSNGHASTQSPRPKPPAPVPPQTRSAALRVQPRSNDDRPAPSQFGASPRPTPPVPPPPTGREGGFWRRVARFFGP